jgi:replicative DNA helicase
MRSFTLADDFADQQAEQTLLAALLSQPALLRQYGQSITPDLFVFEQNAALEVLEGRLPSAVTSWQPASDPEACIAVLQDLHTRRLLANLQEQLAQLLYNPSQPVSGASALIEQWLSKRIGNTAPSQLAKSAVELVDSVLGEMVARNARRVADGNAVMGVKSGLPKLDALLNGFCPGLHVLGGAPGAGKTTLALQMAVHAASTGCPVLYLSYENTPANLLLKAVCAEALSIPLDAERGYGDPVKLRAAADRLKPSFERLAIVEGTLRLSAGSLRGLASGHFAGRRGLIVVDYLQRAAHQHSYDQLRQSVSRLAAEMREISSALDSPVLALASQNRSGGDYGRGGGSAQLDSLKESGDLEYSADSVTFLRADKRRTLSEPVRAIELAVVKNRFGPLGAIPLVYRADVGVLREDRNEVSYQLQWSPDR